MLGTWWLGGQADSPSTTFGLHHYATEFADTLGEILEKGKLQMREKCENAGDIMLWMLVGSPRFHDQQRE